MARGFNTLVQVAEGENLFLDSAGKKFKKPGRSMANGNCVMVEEESRVSADGAEDAALEQYYAAEVDEPLSRPEVMEITAQDGGNEIGELVEQHYAEQVAIGGISRAMQILVA